MGDEAQTSGAAPSSDELKRDELNEKAEALGIQNPEKLKNKEAVEEAIADAEAVSRFSRDEVLEHARPLTGYSRNHMVGALHGNDQESFTKDEATRIGDKFAEHEAVS